MSDLSGMEPDTNSSMCFQPLMRPIAIWGQLNFIKPCLPWRWIYALGKLSPNDMSKFPLHKADATLQGPLPKIAPG